jgi:protein O-mannosyl-transferase
MSRRSKRPPAVHSSRAVSSAGKIAGTANSRPPASERRPFGWDAPWLFGLFLVAATLIAYLPVWRAGFIWDDDILLTRNLLIKDPHGWYHFWCATTTPDYFPMTSTSLWLEWRLWGMNAAGYHVTNVLLHAANALLLWRILAWLKIPGAKLAAAIFALHPVNVASVAWIAERKNTLAMLFFLLALLSYLKFDDTRIRRWYWVSVGTFALALLSKTAAAPLPLVLLGIAWWRHGRVEWKDIFRSATFFGVAGFLALITIWFQYHNSIGHDVVRTDDFWSRLAIAGRAVWFYFYKEIFPINLLPVYPRWHTGAVTMVSFVPALLLAAGFLLCWRYRAKWGKAPLLGFGYFIVMSLPVLGFLNIYFFRYSLVADHYQYFPIIGIIALAAAGTSVVLKPFPNGKIFFCGALLLLLGILTWRQVEIYRDANTLWRATLAGNSDSAVAHDGLGCVLLQNGKIDEAILHFRQALQMDPDYAPACYNLGNALLQKGAVDDAIAQFQKALQTNPRYAEADNNLGNALLQKGDVDEAITQFQKALQISPDDAEACNNLGNALLRKGAVDDAISNFQKALQINPGYADALNNLGNALFRKGAVDESVLNFQKALQIKPDDAEACYNLGNALLQKGNMDEAIAQFQKALQINPDYADAHANLGGVLLQKGAVDDAIVQFQKALQINPDDVETRNNLGGALLRKGSINEAIAQFHKALQIKPNDEEAFYNLGNALLQKGNVDEAIACFQKALQINPDYADAHNNLGGALYQKGKVNEAIFQFQKALGLNAGNVQTLNNLAWILATCSQASLRNGNEAVELAQRANHLTNDSNPSILATLAAAYAEAGRFPEAVEAAQRALQIAGTQPNNGQVNVIQSQLKLYQAGVPLHDVEH